MDHFRPSEAAGRCGLGRAPGEAWLLTCATGSCRKPRDRRSLWPGRAGLAGDFRGFSWPAPIVILSSKTTKLESSLDLGVHGNRLNFLKFGFLFSTNASRPSRPSSVR